MPPRQRLKDKVQQSSGKSLPQNLYNGYGFGSDPEQRDWALRQGGAMKMIDSANQDWAREQAEKAGAYKKTGR